jgi:hypothetical protein
MNSLPYSVKSKFQWASCSGMLTETEVSTLDGAWLDGTSLEGAWLEGASLEAGAGSLCSSLEGAALEVSLLLEEDLLDEALEEALLEEVGSLEEAKLLMLVLHPEAEKSSPRSKRIGKRFFMPYTINQKRARIKARFASNVSYSKLKRKSETPMM